MKQFLIFVTVLVSGCVGQGPYAPSGWRPNGPSFELPQTNQQNPQYLPPLDPRNPTIDYPQDVDVSVQGLPGQEQQPIFQVSPINGQQYFGGAVNNDVKRLDDMIKQAQFQAQQQRYKELARHRQLDQANANQPKQTPRQFVQKTTPVPSTVTPSPEFKSTTPDTAAEAVNLNNGEFLADNEKQSEKVTVEVSKQKIQEFPPELLLSPISQLNFQQVVPSQLAAYRAPFYQTALPQKQLAGYDAETHFAAFPSVLAQQQLQLNDAQLQSPAYLVPQGYSDQQQVVVTPQPQFENVPQVQNPQVQIQYPIGQGYTPVQNPQTQSPQNQYPQVEAVQPQTQNPQVQIQYPSQVYTPGQQYPQAQYPQNPLQANQAPGYPQSENDQTQQVQFVYQQFQPQGQLVQAQFAFPSEYQQQTLQQQQQTLQRQQQAQDGFLQSGLDVNQQGNGVEQQDKEDGDADVNTATAVATAFGARTQPRVAATYGVPAQDPNIQASGFQGTGNQDQNREDAQADAEATSAKRKKNARLRMRRVRPVFTLDNTGHLVLSKEQ